MVSDRQGGEPSSLLYGPGEAAWTADEVESVVAGLAADIERVDRQIADLQGNIAGVLDDSGDGSGDDQADSGSKAFEREQEMALLAKLERTRLEIELALQRVSNGSYGTCDSCSGPIGKRRLQAFPRATLCVDCKQKQERR
jgi:DnaK suppressor protein